jgi:predicted MFS family arabinose efflux permease
VYYCIWCKRFLSFAMASIIDLTKSGIAIDSYLSPYLWERFRDIKVPFWMIFGVLIFTFLCVLTMILIDRKYDKQYIPPAASDSHSKSAKLKEVCHIKPILWMLALCSGLIKGVGFAFNTNSAYILQHRFNYTAETAGLFRSIQLFISIPMSPMFGILIDAVAKNTVFIIICTFITIAGMLSMAMVPECDKCALVALPFLLTAISMGLITPSARPGLKQVADKNQLATAYGLNNCTLSASFVLLVFVSGIISEYTQENNQFYFLAGMSVIGFVMSIAIMWMDCKEGGLLFYKQRFSSVFDVKGHIIEKIKKDADIKKV